MFVVDVFDEVEDADVMVEDELTFLPFSKPFEDVLVTIGLIGATATVAAVMAI